MFIFIHSKTAISFNIVLLGTYFFGTIDMLVGLHVSTNFQKYKKKKIRKN